MEKKGYLRRALEASIPGPVVLRLADVASEALSWLWPGRVPLGKVALLVGDPGLGKSLLALDIAARVSRGLPWPEAGVGNAPQGSVLLLSAEDDAADTIRPRLEALGGDPANVRVLQAARQGACAEEDVPFSLARDLMVLQYVLSTRRDVRLIIFDPVSAYLDGLDVRSNAALRPVLARLQALAAASGAAVLAINHFTKRANASLLYRSSGSVGFAAAARAVWATLPDPQAPGRLLLLPLKTNLASGATGLAYRIVPCPAAPAQPILAWEPEPVAMAAAEAVGCPTAAVSASRVQAALWLLKLLAGGPVPSQEAERRATEAGFSRRTLARARRDVGVVFDHPNPHEPWTWRLPGEQAS